MPLNLAFPAADHEATHPAFLSFTDADPFRPIEMEVHGRWSHRLGVEVSADIRRRLRQRPTQLIIDLRGLIDPDGASLALWLATRRVCSAMRPQVALALCLPATTTLDRRLRRIDATRLARFTTMPGARAATTHERSPLMPSLRLAAGGTGPATALTGVKKQKVS
jgi:hypothetical protein